MCPARPTSAVSATALRAAVERLLSAGSVEVHEDGEFLADLSAARVEIREETTGTFLHCWSEERNLLRRILRVAEERQGSIILEVQRFGRPKPGRVELISANRSRGPQRLTREKFKTRLKRLLSEQFPDEQAEGLTSAPDLEHSFSGSYVRGTMGRGRQHWALMAVSSAENLQTAEAILSFGLLWLDWVREHSAGKVVSGLRLFLPDAGAALTAHRLQALADWVDVETYILDETLGCTRKVDPRDAGNLETWLGPHREVLAAKAAAQSAIEKIHALAPEDVDTVVRPAPSGSLRTVAFRFRGLEFARWENGRLECLSPQVSSFDHWADISGPEAPALKEMVRLLRVHRSADSDRQHPLYRMSPERWLESYVLRDICRIDARLDADFCFPQVPAFAPAGRGGSMGAGRGVMDVLGVTREGRLAVIELKADEDLHLALQGADYWLRVRWHQQQGDFHRCGYFAGKELQDAAPLLYLVAPGLRYHPATEVLRKYLSPEVQISRVGLNEDWRRELKVIFRQ